MKRKKIFLSFCVILITFFVTIKSLNAGELVFEFLNPSFGGSAFYGSFLLQEAQAQNTLRPPAPSRPVYKPPSFLEQFKSALERQIAYTLAHKLVQQIFGEVSEENQLQPGTYTVGDLEINIEYGAEGIELTLTDISTGETTQLVIPEFSQTQ